MTESLANPTVSVVVPTYNRRLYFIFGGIKEKAKVTKCQTHGKR